MTFKTLIKNSLLNSMINLPQETDQMIENALAYFDKISNEHSTECSAEIYQRINKTRGQHIYLDDELSQRIMMEILRMNMSIKSYVRQYALRRSHR